MLTINLSLSLAWSLLGHRCCQKKVCAPDYVPSPGEGQLCRLGGSEGSRPPRGQALEAPGGGAQVSTQGTHRLRKEDGVHLTLPPLGHDVTVADEPGRAGLRQQEKSKGLV